MSLRTLLPAMLLGVALLIPSAAEARSCKSRDSRVADLKAKGVDCKVANTVAKKYVNRCMGAPCTINAADVRWRCAAERRNRCASGKKKVTWIFAGGEHG